MKIFHNQKKLVDHQKQIVAESSKYSDSTVHGASLLTEWLTNKHQLALEAFNIDVQTLFKFSNQRFQRKFDCVIGHGDFREKLQSDLEELITVDGPVLKSLLSKSHCVQTMEDAEAILNFDVKVQSFDHDGCKSLVQYEESIVVYENMILHGNDVPDVEEEIQVIEDEKPEEDEETTDENDPNIANVEDEDVMNTDVEPLSEMDIDVPEVDSSKVVSEEEPSGSEKEKKKKKKKKQMTFEPLSTIRGPYITEILKNLEKFFPQKLMKEFDLFDQRKWKEDVAVNVQFSQSWRHLKKLLSYFDIRYKPEFFKNFKELVQNLMNPEVYPNWCKHKESLPSLFWQNVLGSKIEIDPDLLQLIKTLLVLPVGSSEAERVFR